MTNTPAIEQIYRFYIGQRVRAQAFPGLVIGTFITTTGTIGYVVEQPQTGSVGVFRETDLEARC